MLSGLVGVIVFISGMGFQEGVVFITGNSLESDVGGCLRFLVDAEEDSCIFLLLADDGVRFRHCFNEGVTTPIALDREALDSGLLPEVRRGVPCCGVP